MIRLRFLICVSTLLCVAVPLHGQVILRQAQVTAAEYFIGSDPGVGKGTPVSISNSSTNVPLDLSAIKLSPGQFVHLRVKIASGIWSAPVNLMYPTRTVSAAEVVVGDNPNAVALGHGIPMTPVGRSFGTAVVNVEGNVSKWNHNDTIWVRALSSQYLWSEPVGSIAFIDTILKSVALITPSNSDTLQLFYPPRPIVFSWSKEAIATGISVEYSLHLVGPGLDTIFANVVDTSLTANIMPLLKIASLYGWSVAVSDGYATVASQDSFLFRTSDNITAVHGPESLPKVFALYQNYPNPFNPTTTISYDIPERSRVTLIVYDILGRRVEALIDGEKQDGHYDVTFDASRLPSGVYPYRLEAGDYNATKKLVVVK